LIFSVLLQYHISELSRYFWSIEVLAPYSAMLQVQHLTSFFLKFSSSLLVKGSSPCWMLLLRW
jgi:hypothetical protein